MCRNLNILCLITTKFCLCTSNSAVGTCAKLYGDLNFRFEVMDNRFSPYLDRNLATLSGIMLRLSASPGSLVSVGTGYKTGMFGSRGI